MTGKIGKGGRSPRPLPPVEYLRSILKYDQASGKLFWLPRHNGHNRCDELAGGEAFTALANGYRQGTIDGVRYGAHRIIWKMVTGEEPIIIDHIDGDKQNNRFVNLRNVSGSGNHQNKRIGRNNTSGVVGVVFDRQLGLWDATIYLAKKRMRLGRFAKFEDAVIARRQAEADFGFHENHGTRR